MNHSENCRAKSDILYFLTLEPLENVLLYSTAMIHLCTGRTSTTWPQLHPGYWRNCKVRQQLWANSSRTFIICAGGDSAENKCHAACEPPRACHPLCYLGSDFGSQEQTLCIGTLCCDRAAVPAVSEGLPLPVSVPNILAWYGCCTLGYMTSPWGQAQQTSCWISTEKSRTTETVERLLRNFAKSFHLRRKHALSHTLSHTPPTFDYKYLWIQDTSKLCNFYLLKSLF